MQTGAFWHWKTCSADMAYGSFWAKGLTPLPYKFVTLAAGAAHFPLLPFIAASITTRGARFFLEAALLKAFGEPVREFIEKRLTVILLILLVVIVAGVALVELF